jgi:hypothetical protein
MLHQYFDFWSGFWHFVAEVVDKRIGAVEWFVEFGIVRKPLADIHPDTGLPRLVAAEKARMEAKLAGGDYRGLAVIFRIDPRQGLVHALHGPGSLVARAQHVLRDEAAE